MTPKDELLRSEGVQHATGEEWRIANSPEWIKWLGQSGYAAQLWVCLVMQVKFSAAKNSIA